MMRQSACMRADGSSRQPLGASALFPTLGEVSARVHIPGIARLRVLPLERPGYSLVVQQRRPQDAAVKDFQRRRAGAFGVRP
eukprot:12009564-Alexandrium_andersonii.AAC.1